MQDVAIDHFIRQRFPSHTVEPLSETNNTLFKVCSERKSFVVKELTDTDIPVCYTVEVSLALEDKLKVQKIHEFQYRRDAPARMVSEFISGRPLSEIIHSLTEQEDIDRVTQFLVDYGDACVDLPRLNSSFGLFKVNAPRFDDLQSFLVSYARKYWSRIRLVISANEERAWVDEWLECGLSGALAGPDTRTVPIDSNLRNIIVMDDGELCLLNLPIVGVSTRAHAVAALSIHLRYSPVFETYRAQAMDSFSRDEKVAALHLELWQVLGVMSFYAVRNPHAPQDWINWGSPATLLTHFTDLVRILKGLAT